MTKQNKLIVGGVVLVALLFLYDRNEKMKKMAMMKAQAEANEIKTQAEETKAIKKANFNRKIGDDSARGGSLIGLPTMVDNG
jgi:hypothetical protein